MLPSDHEIVHANLFDPWVSAVNGSHPATGVRFSPDGHQATPDSLLSQITAFPRHICFWGNPLHQNREFLRLVLIDLVNNDHLVNISDTGERKIDWKHVMPGVSFSLRYTADFNDLNFKRLRDGDELVFYCSTEYAYRKNRDIIRNILSSYKPKFDIVIKTMRDLYLGDMMIEDELDVVLRESL